MGACCSWCKEDDAFVVSKNLYFNVTYKENLIFGFIDQGPDQERTHLLIDPSSNNSSIQRGGVPEDYHYGSLPKESAQQSGMNRILEEIST